MKTKQKGGNIVKRKLTAFVLTFGLLCAISGFMAIPVSAAVLNESRIVGDANGDGNFNIIDLVRLKKYFTSDSVDIQKMADMDWNGIITSLDLAECRKSLLRDAIIMEVPAEDVLVVKSMRQIDNKIILTLKNNSNVWETNSTSSVGFTLTKLDSSTNTTTVSLGRMEALEEKTVEIVVDSTCKKTTATVNAEYWSKITD